MRRRSVVVLVSTAAVLSAASFAFLHRNASPKAAPSAISAPAALREAVLHVKWHEQSTARLPGGQAVGPNGDGTLTGELELEADLALSRERTTDGDDAVRAELRDVRASHVVIAGQEVLRSDAEGKGSLERRPIHLVIDGGRITRVLVDKNSASLPVQLTESIARQVLLPAPEDKKSFEREEQTSAGTMKVAYEAHGDGYRRNVVDAIALENLPDTCSAPACAVRARGEGEVRFDAGNVIVSLTEKREISAKKQGEPAMLEGTASFEATRVREGDVAAASVDPSTLSSKAPGEAFESEAEKHAALVRLSAGATIEDVIGGISGASTGGLQSLEKGWLVRSSAFLELHPELLGEVAVRFEDEGLGRGGRIAILDLLAATGGEEAQKVLMKTLDGATARGDDARLEYIQRIMLVQSPTTTTSRELRERFTRSEATGDAQTAFAEAHALGAVAGRLAAQGAGAEAKAAVDTLAHALDQAKTPDAKAAYLSALGNAGSPKEIVRIASHANDDDATVRRSVASALRKTDEPQARKTLVTLAKDSDPDVQVAALASIGEHPVDDAEQRDLARLLDTPQLAGQSEAQLTTLLLRQGPPSPEVRASLEHLLSRTEDPRLAAQIRFAFESASRQN